MSTLKHTPGKWIIEVHETSPGFDIRATEGGQCIATLQDHFMGHGEVNARLIAAAPELLALLADFVSTNPLKLDAQDSDDYQHLFLGKAQALINKVNGGIE